MRRLLPVFGDRQRRIHLPLALLTLLLCLSVLQSSAAQSTADLASWVRSTCRLHGQGSNATCFLVRAGETADGAATTVLVTAAHVLEVMKGNKATLELRVADRNGEFRRDPRELVIRQDGEPRWTKHPEQDIAVLPLPEWQSEIVDTIAIANLMRDASFGSLQPGQLVRCIGYPHAAHLDPTKEGFPLVRLGCIASYPIVPLASHPTLLVDFNTFEGDSGGIVVSATTDATTGEVHHQLIGLMHGQHFIDEKYQLIYQRGHIRKRLGLSIVVNSQAIVDTVELHLEKK